MSRKKATDITFKSWRDAMAYVCVGDTVRLNDTSFVVSGFSRCYSDNYSSPQFVVEGRYGNTSVEYYMWHEGQAEVVAQANKREFKKLMSEQVIRMGNTIRVNEAYRAALYGNDRGQDHDVVAPGQYGEVTGVDQNGQVTVKVDSAFNAIFLNREHFDVIDWDNESAHRRRQRDAGFAYEKDHVHTWTLKWEETFRECPCGATQWRLECWTGYAWRSKTPRAILVDRPDLTRPEGFLEPIPFVEWTPAYRRRFQDILPNRLLNVAIDVVGLGGIGSFLAVSLAKMGFNNLGLYDFDVVTEENMGTQVYGRGHLGQYKANAIADVIRYMSHVDGAVPACYRMPYDRNSYRAGARIVISAVDSMEARKQVYNTVLYSQSQHLIDVRMGAENALMYVVNMFSRDDRMSYQKTLYSDEAADQEVCTAKATVYTGSMIAGQACKAVKDILTNNPNYARVTHWNIAANTMKCHTLAEAKARWDAVARKKAAVREAQRLEMSRSLSGIRPQSYADMMNHHQADSMRYTSMSIPSDWLTQSAPVPTEPPPPAPLPHLAESPI